MYGKMNAAKTIETKRMGSDEFRKAWDSSREEYRLIGEMISLRKENHLTQTDLAALVNGKQQSISRIEKREHSPSLKQFCNIIHALGYELKIVKRSN